jgi:hypothetical protein
MGSKVNALALEFSKILYLVGDFGAAGGAVANIFAGWIPDLVFSDGFESGDTTAWSSAVP